MMRRRVPFFRLFVSVAGTALLGVAMSAPAIAQRIAGVVRDSATGEPLTGAVVSVLDSAATLYARNISDAAGRFSVARASESARLAVIRIGYAPRELSLGPADTVITVTMRAIPTALSAVTATGRRVCPGDRDGGQALELWEQVRSALLAAVVSRELNAPRVGLMSFKRTREPFRKQIEDETRESKFIVADRPYVAARPAWVFAYDGYMKEETGGERTYYAPDEGVLLDVTFASTHCLRAVEGTGDHGDEIGLGFDPIESDWRDTLVDIKGVLWVDRAVRGLRSLDFEYTGIERLARGSGGELTFRIMPTGAPIIQRWLIHSAILAVDVEQSPSGIVRRPPPRAERSNVRLLGYQETGGEVGFAEWNNGLTWNGPFPRFRGVVVDSAQHPVSGAVVRLENRAFDDSLVSDSIGRFNFPPVQAGFYRLYVTDSVFSMYGAPTARPRMLLLNGDGQEETLSMRSRAEMLSLACPRREEYPPGSAVILGRVVGADGEPATDVRVDASWRGSYSADVKRRANTDGDGHFVICGAELNGAIDLSSSTRRESTSVHLDALKSDVTGVTLVLKRRPH